MPPTDAQPPLATIQETFARIMSHFGHRLPEDAVLHRQRGQIGGEEGDGQGVSLQLLSTCRLAGKEDYLVEQCFQG